MKFKMACPLIFAVLAFIANTQVMAQTAEPASPFKIIADIVSSYVWRGSLSTNNPTPNFQPTLSYAKGIFEIGVWGSTDFTGSYKEVDPFISLTSGQLKFAVTDYNWNFNKANYFNYKNSNTGHRFEGTIGFTGPCTLPISITWNTLFYGFDKKSTDPTKQAYSTYIELGYSKGPANFFFGFTPWASYYNNYGATAFDPEAAKKSFSVVNIGASLSKGIKITELYTLPVKASLIVNPSATYSRSDYIHLIIGITI
jgi:hypothetical protein